MLHQIRIDAPRSRVFDALTQENDLRSWWTGDSKASAALGGEAIFGFFSRATVFRMRIDELAPPKRVVWSCLGDVEEWTGTQLSFDLEPLDRDRTLLHFVHGGWRSASGYFASCNTTWGALMVRLKDYVERREPGPFFTGIADAPPTFRRIVNLSAEPSAVYAALTTPEGLKGWWTPDAELGGDVGAELVFRFGQNYNVMRVEKLLPGREVRWECVRQYQAPPRFNKPDE